MVRLIKIVRRDHQVWVTFKVGNGKELRIGGGTGGNIEFVQDFEVFRKYCFLHHGFWPRHRCEDAVTDREASRLWNDDVQDAVLAGRGE